jgi:hypothetical protein
MSDYDLDVLIIGGGFARAVGAQARGGGVPGGRRVKAVKAKQVKVCRSAPTGPVFATSTPWKWRAAA